MNDFSELIHYVLTAVAVSTEECCHYTELTLYVGSGSRDVEKKRSEVVELVEKERRIPRLKREHNESKGIFRGM